MSDLPELATKKVGPLPVIGWVAIVGAGVVGMRWWRNRRNGAAIADTGPPIDQSLPSLGGAVQPQWQQSDGYSSTPFDYSAIAAAVLAILPDRYGGTPDPTLPTDVPVSPSAPLGAPAPVAAYQPDQPPPVADVVATSIYQAAHLDYVTPAQQAADTAVAASQGLNTANPYFVPYVPPPDSTGPCVRPQWIPMGWHWNSGACRIEID